MEKRTVGCTQLNEQSSRSHAVFTLRIEGVNDSSKLKVCACVCVCVCVCRARACVCGGGGRVCVCVCTVAGVRQAVACMACGGVSGG
jgi:hypothetical protein